MVFIPAIFCKKSVFGILFFGCFGLGTIYGAVLARAGAVSDFPWLCSYCQALTAAAPPGIGLRLWFRALPFGIAVLLGHLPGATRLLPLLVALRGVLLSYCLAVCYLARIPATGYWLWSAALLPLFYMLCQKIWLNAFGRIDRSC